MKYEDVLSKSGFKTELTYKDLAAPTNKKMIGMKIRNYLIQPSI